MNRRLGVDAVPEAGRNAGYKTDYTEDEASRNAGNEDVLAERYEVDRPTENVGSNAEGYEADITALTCA